MQIILGILIPFIGTTLGSAMVFFMKENIHNKAEKILLGFTAGVMIASSIWSLLLPSIEMAQEQNIIGWLPASLGFLIGVIFLLITNYFINKLTIKKTTPSKFKKTIMMIIAVTLHNIPEGMAVGVIFASFLSKNTLTTLAAAYSLSIGIAIQNFPEGAIVSMPLKEKNISKWKSFLYGTLSGIVEPIGAIITLVLTSKITRILPYLLSFAAGAMIYVVIDELLPETQKGKHSNLGIIGVTLGFLIMMILDITFS